MRVIEQQAIAPLRNRVFASLDALNAALLDNVARINARPFQKREGSRDEIFLRQEKELLVPLPGKPYEMITRKAATVNFNYHVAFDGGWYSVPFPYVRREVEVCATKSAVWVVCDGERIAMHKRLHGRGVLFHEPRPHARRPPRLRRVERGSLPQMGKGNRPRLRRRHRGDPLVEADRAAVLQVLQGGNGAGRQARKARARAGLRQGALLFPQAELQDHQVDHRQERRAVRGGPGCRRVPARERLLHNPREQRRRAMSASQTTMDKLYGMRLSVMAQAYRDQEEMHGIADMTFDERFAMIVDAEWDSRRINKRTRLLRQAAFSDPEANVIDIRYDADRKLDKARIAELANCEWVKAHRNVVITGASGAGKSWLACALGVAACNAFHSVRYTRMPEMLDELTVSKDEEWLKSKKRHTKCDVLIVDDWLLEKIGGDQSRELLEIVESRLRTGSLIICSQFSPAGWHAKLGEGAIADAVIDRIVYRSDVIHIEGDESMRKRIG